MTEQFCTVHRIQFLTAIVLLVLCVSCAGRSLLHGSGDPCQSLELDSATPFDSTRASSLGGTYRLTMVSEWEEEAGRYRTGALLLQPTDTLHQFYGLPFAGQRRRIGNRPLWGWADIDFDGANGITANGDDPPTSRDPDYPGIILYSNGTMLLGFRMVLDGSLTSMKIQTIARNGFTGTWTNSAGLVRRTRNGHVVPDSHGHFCAIRDHFAPASH